MRPPPAFRIEALSRAGALEVFAQPIEEGLRSPFDEENALAATLHKRGPHFLAGRLAAQGALSALGGAPAPIPRGAEGEPCWPAGLVGSISHTHGLAVAVVGPSEAVAAVGIDVEHRARTLDERTRSLVCHPDEHAWLDAPPPLPAQALMLLVSAKEVVFKAYFPVTGVRLQYRDAVLAPEGEGIRANVVRELELPPPVEPTLPIRWVEAGEHLVLLGTAWR